METIAEFEKQKRTIRELQGRLSDSELKILEAEKLRKKLHNTILVTCVFHVSLVHERFNGYVFLFYEAETSSAGTERQYPSVLPGASSAPG